MDNKRITILYLIDTFISPPDKPSEGGAGKQLYLLSTYLNPDAFRPIVAQLIPSPSLSMATGKMGSVETLHLPTKKFYNLHGLHQIIRLSLLAKREKVDIIHTFFEKSEVMGWLASRFSGVPVWITSRRDLGFVRKGVYRKIFKIAARDCSKCVANCHAIKNNVIEQEKLPDEKVSVIYNGLDFSPYMKPSNGDHLRSELGIDNSVHIVGMIADIYFEIKGQKYFLEAARKILKKVSNVKFLLIGEGHLRRKYEEMAYKLGIEKNVFFLGKRSDIPGILSAFDVSVLCSTSEGLSNVIMESMAAGKPVVATNVGGNSEIVIDGVTGYLVPPADSDALATAVIALLQSPDKAKSMGVEGRRVVKEKFSLSEMVENYEKLYRDLVSRNRI
jgi:glycosyltransferase involved in cell wall biosynthesis